MILASISELFLHLLTSTGNELGIIPTLFNKSLANISEVPKTFVTSQRRRRLREDEWTQFRET